MKARKLLVTLGIILVSSVLVMVPLMAGCAPSPAEKPAEEEPEVFHWRFQVAFGSRDASYYADAQQQAGLIEEGSEGRIKVSVYPVGALVAPEEQLSAVVKGSIEMALDCGAAFGDLVPAGYATVPPGSFENPEEEIECYYEWGLFEILQEAFEEKGLHLLTIQPIGPNVFMGDIPLDTLADLKNKKVFPLPQVVDTVKDIGAVPTDVPGFDVYTAMKLGTIDAFTWTLGELEYANFKEVVKNVVIQPICYPGNDFTVINKKAWDALGPELQGKVQSYVLAHTREVMELYTSFDAGSVAAAREYGVNFITWSEADKEEYYEIARSRWGEIADLSPRSAQCIDIIKDYLKSKGRY